MQLQTLADEHRDLLLVFTNLHLHDLQSLLAIHALLTFVLQVIVTDDVLLEWHLEGLCWHERILIVDRQRMLLGYNVPINRIGDHGERVMVVLAIQVDNEAVDVFTAVDVEAHLAILVREAEVPCRCKHELTAAHVVVHAVLEHGLQRVLIQRIEVN